jgi:type IV fimbrial biogenesis protein FimT
MMNETRGFTLVELMVVIALIGIIATIALPAFRDMLAGNRILTSANELVIAFHQARSEALRRSDTVTIAACKPDCGTTGTAAWSNGWQTTFTGTVVAEHAALASKITAGANGATAFALSYGYSSQGRLGISVQNQILLCDEGRTGEAGKLITLEPIGRVSVTTTPCP